MDGLTLAYTQRLNRLSWILFWLVMVTLALGTALAGFSALRMCSESCAIGHKYRLYGWSFEAVGLCFFSLTAGLHFFSIRFAICRLLVSYLLAIAVGAEGMFIYAQKYIIGSMCPLCLGIAATVVLAFILSIVNVVYNRTMGHLGLKGVMMKRPIYGTSLVILMAFGFFFTQIGFSKFSQLQATENSIKQEIAFGNLQSPIEVYVFTDWECSACRKMEPIITSISPSIMREAKLIFADMAAHTASLNFIPYNLSFMIHNKAKYFNLREGLTQLSQDEEAPTEKQIKGLATSLGASYVPLNYSDVSIATTFFNHVAEQFNVDSTPTVVVVNSSNQKGKKFPGSEITEKNILGAIEALK